MQGPGVSSGEIQLVVLKSFAEEQQILARLNRLVTVLSILAALLGMAIAAFIARTVTRPMESLVAGTRALATRETLPTQVRERGAERSPAS